MNGDRLRKLRQGKPHWAYSFIIRKKHLLQQYMLYMPLFYLLIIYYHYLNISNFNEHINKIQTRVMEKLQAKMFKTIGYKIQNPVIAYLSVIIDSFSELSSSLVYNAAKRRALRSK